MMFTSYFIHVVYGAHCWFAFFYLNKSSIDHYVEQTIACYVKRIHGFQKLLLNRMAKNKRFHRRETLMNWCIHYCWALFQVNQIMKMNAEHYKSWFGWMKTPSYPIGFELEPRPSIQCWLLFVFGMFYFDYYDSNLLSTMAIKMDIECTHLNGNNSRNYIGRRREEKQIDIFPKRNVF